jgi:carbonic anhydrase
MKALAGLAMCPLCAAEVLAAEGAHWSYSGKTGPEHWGGVDPASKVCAIGTQQSPLDIGRTIKAELPKLEIDWRGKPDTIVNNGHTIQVNFSGGTLSAGPSTYTLLQVHFHHPSEHLIEGKRFPMEAHFVHRAASGSLGVVGVMLTPGKSNAGFERIIATMPAKAGPAVKADSTIDASALLPATRSYYRYSGSLTTPPCSEVVDWMLFTAPVEVAEADIGRFAKLYAMNARPAQKPDRRFVLQSL